MADAVKSRVSVVIPAYNVAPFITQAVASALGQTHAPIEVIVVNDGSPDAAEMEAALQPFRDRIRYLTQPNRGAAAARNAAIGAAQGDTIGFLDGDDAWYPEFLAAQLELMQRDRLDMAYANALIVGDHILAGRTYMQTTPSRGPVTLESLLDFRCQVITSGTLVRKDVLIRVGLFDETVYRGQDFDMWLRLAHAGVRIGYQDRVLLEYRMRAGSLSGTAVDQARREFDIFQGIKRKLQLSDAQVAIVERQLHYLGGEVELALGKAALAAGNYAAARRHFGVAWRARKSLKLQAIRAMLAIAPGLVRRLQARFRPPEG